MDSADRPHAGQTRPPTVVVLLAGGGGSRFHDPEGDIGHKLLAPLPSTGGEPAGTVVERAIAHAVEAATGPVVVVTGAVDLPLPPGVIRRHNPDWESGQMSSLRAGLDAAAQLGAASVVVGLADQPSVSAADWRRVADADGPIAVATYGGRRRNPVKLDAEVWRLLPAGGDEGARALMRIRPDLVREVPCTSSPADIDTVEDLRRWQSN